MGARQYVGDAHLQAGAAQLLELQQQVVRLLVSRILHRFKVKRVKDSRATRAMPLTAHQKGEVTGTKLGDALKTPRLRATTARSAVVDMYCVYSSPFKYARRGHPNSKNTEEPRFPLQRFRLLLLSHVLTARSSHSCCHHRSSLKLQVVSVSQSQHICYG